MSALLFAVGKPVVGFLFGVSFAFMGARNAAMEFEADLLEEAPRAELRAQPVPVPKAVRPEEAPVLPAPQVKEND